LEVERVLALRAETPTVDIHCVTAWSKLDTTWTGVSIDTLLEGLETEAEYVSALCDDGYRTNLPLEDGTGGQRGSPIRSASPRRARRPGGWATHRSPPISRTPPGSATDASSEAVEP
jgi:hypothetical protein